MSQPHLEVFVPGRPLPKQSARFGKGRSWQPKAKTEYKRLVTTYVRNAWIEAGKVQIAAPFAVDLDFVFGWPKSAGKSKRSTYQWRTARPDIDNLAKMCLDALADIIPEDANVSRLTLSKRNGPRDSEGVTIRIESI